MLKEMKRIDIVENFDDNNWHEIQKVIYESHADNRRNGVDIRNAHLTPQELQNSIGQNGKCFIALDGKKIVGTCSVAFQQKKCWYVQGEVAYNTLEGVLPEYKGQHIYKRLSQKRLEYIQSRGCNVIYMNVAEKNYARRIIAQKEGFKKVAIHYNSYNPHNYITYCYWIGKQPFSDFEISIKYGISLLKLWLKYFKRRIFK